MKFGLFLILTAVLVLFWRPALANHSCSKSLRVAIVDTGLDLNDPRFKGHICPTGHKNFVSNESLEDLNGHGTFVAGLIQQYAGDANYCLLIYKYYKDYEDHENINRENQSLQEAIDNGADIVNFSGGGSGFNEKEFLIIKNNPDVTFVVAAGNEHQNLDLPENKYYPASYWLKNEVVVENIDKSGILAPSSNYSKKAQKEVGVDVLSYFPNNGVGTLTGTSMSTAIKTGKLVDSMLKSCKYME
jgi:thermitase